MIFMTLNIIIFDLITHDFLTLDLDSISTYYSTLSFSKLYQDFTLERSFSLKSYFIPREKIPKDYDRQLKMGF